MFTLLRRILFHTIATLSAVSLLAILILWPLSYSHEDTIRYDGRAGSSCGIRSLVGRLEFFNGHGNFPPKGFVYDAGPTDLTQDPWSYSDRSISDRFFHQYRRAGCEWRIAPPGSDYYPGGMVYIPYAYLTALSTLFPALWLLTRARRHRATRSARGLCQVCGYDLRAHIEGRAHPELSTSDLAPPTTLPPRCPECGTPFPTSPSAKPPPPPKQPRTPVQPV